MFIIWHNEADETYCEMVTVTVVVVHSGQTLVWNCDVVRRHTYQITPTVVETHLLWVALLVMKRSQNNCLGKRWVVPMFILKTTTTLQTFNGLFSRTTWVSRYQEGKTNLDFTGARDNEWQWHQLGHMQVCTSLQTDNHASTPPFSFYRPDALPAAQPTASKHWRQSIHMPMNSIINGRVKT